MLSEEEKLSANVLQPSYAEIPISHPIPSIYPKKKKKKKKKNNPNFKIPNPLTLSATASAAGISIHGNDFGLVGDILKEGKGTLELHAVDSLGGLAGVLEADTQVRAPGAGALSGRNFLSSVTDLYESEVHRQYYSLGKIRKRKIVRPALRLSKVATTESTDS